MSYQSLPNGPRGTRPRLRNKSEQILHVLTTPWRYVCLQCATFLRAIGFVLATITAGKEAPKVLVAKSRRSAFARCGVHILPSLVSAALLVLNLYGFYIGFELQGPRGDDGVKMGVLQVCAKSQELLIVASAADIIFHCVRSQLIFGDGLPLGLVGSGFNFTQISFFWSLDFWGSVTYESSSRVKKFGFLALLSVCGILAAVAGPATAILMIPREMDWPVGGGTFWLNGTEQQLWPTNLDAASLADYDCTTQDKQLYDPRCPSAGFISIYEHFSNWRVRRGTIKTNFEVADRNIRKTINCTFDIPDRLRSVDTWASTAHAPTGTMLDVMSTLYADALGLLSDSQPLAKPEPRSLSQALSRTYQTLSKVPAVRTACFPDPTLFKRNGTSNLPFVVIPQNGTVYSGTNTYGYQTLDMTTAVQTKLNEAYPQSNFSSSSQKHVLVAPVKLPDESSTGSLNSIGLIILSNTDMSGFNWAATTCTVDARWAPANIKITNDNRPYLYDYNADSGASLIQSALTEENMGWGGWHPPDDGSWEPIVIDPSWFLMLAPKIPAVGAGWFDVLPGNRTTLETVIGLLYPTSNDRATTASFTNNLTYNDYIHSATEHMVSTMIADGISRCGSQINLNYARQALDPIFEGNFTVMTTQIAQAMVRQGDPSTDWEPFYTHPGDNFTQLTMQASYHGFVMTAQSWFDWFCVAVLITHMLLALGHTIWVVWHGTTSEAWDTTTELTAFAMVSPPPSNALMNTTAGIRKFGTVGQMAWVETAVKHEGDRSQAVGQRLQLMVAEKFSVRDDARKVLVNDSYE